MEKVYVELNDKNLLSFRVEGDTSKLNTSEFLLQSKTMTAMINNAWTVVGNSKNCMKVTPFKWMGIKNMFFEFLSEEDTKKLIEFKNNVYITPSHLQLNKEALAMGLGIFLDLNLDEEKLLPYLFKIKTAEVEKLSEKIKELLDEEHWIERNIESKFYYLTGHYFSDMSYAKTNALLQESIEKEDFNTLFSFLYGIILAGYATIKTQGIVFQIPTVKSLYMNKEVILQVFHYLKKYFVFSITEWSVTQIASKDGLFEELMFIYMKNFSKQCTIVSDFIKGEPTETKTNECKALWHKYVNNLNTKEALLDFIATLGVENPEFIDKLKVRKIKIHTK